ncbi:MAG: hypothetical protein QOJ87_2236 [Verrucomicrobiota bacterium]|jgi:hypothetical protein
MNPRYFCCIAILTALAIPSMSAQTPAPVSNGIEGVIMVSPSRPGPTRKDGPSSAPAGNLEFAVKRADVKVAAFTTDAEGRFRVSLPPGHYTVLREDPGAKIGHWRFETDVKPGEVTKVQWTGDSGMR